jgi:hypothetical protein
MVVIGTLKGVVDICVSINPDQFANVMEMYPEHIITEQVGSEDIGWLFDGVTFSPPLQG